MLYLLAVVGVALRYGRGPAVLSALVNVLAFDFFLVPPRLSFAIADLQYVLTFAVMLIVGLVVGQLTAGLRYQARIATRRERRSHSLFEVARDLSGELVVEQVVATASRAISAEFHAKVRVFVLAQDDRLALVGANEDTPGIGPRDGPLGVRSPAGGRPGNRHHSRELVALPAAQCVDANAGRPRTCSLKVRGSWRYPSSGGNWKPSLR